MRKVALLAAVQIAVILAWAGYHERVRASAPTFRIPLLPRDPYDPLRGRYFVLNPLDGRIKTGQPDTPLAEGAVTAFLRGEKYFDGAALVEFCPAGAVHRVCGLRRLDQGPPAAGVWARGRANVHYETMTYRGGGQVAEPGWRVSLDLGLERFFLPEKLSLPGSENAPGWELEVSHRPGMPLLPRRLWFQGRPVED